MALPVHARRADALGETGVGRVFFICPNFAVDCLETLYDIDHELKPFYFDQIKQAGRTPGEEASRTCPASTAAARTFECFPTCCARI